MYLNLPLHERDRRWDGVRIAMRDAGLDGLLVPIGNGVDSRYLTLIRGSAIFFSSDTPHPAVVMDQGQSNEWVPDPIETVRQWGEPTIRAIRSTGIESGTVGIVGLGSGELTHVDAGDGSAVHEPLVAVIQAFPRLRFVDATDLVGGLRARKSDVEIELIRQAASHASTAITNATRLVEPGAVREVLLGSAVGSVLELGSEFRPSSVRIHRPDGSLSSVCEDGGLVVFEVTGCVAGYTVTERQTVPVGRPSAGWDAALAAADQVRTGLLDELRPGVTMHRLRAVAEEVGALRAATVRLDLHGIGLGADGPIVTPDWSSRGAMAMRLDEGMCLSLTIDVRRSDAGGPSAISSLNVVLTGGRPVELTPGATLHVAI